jgi:peptidyl-prolyl cis-trans isomerase B (cyclophilin B)
MARSSNPDSASSQFFIMHKAATHLDGQYSAFGRVVKGQEIVDAIATMPSGANGAVKPESAVVLKSVKIVNWPLD